MGRPGSQSQDKASKLAALGLDLSPASVFSSTKHHGRKKAPSKFGMYWLSSIAILLVPVWP